MKRNYFSHDNLRFSYLDNGEKAANQTMVILHAHWMGAADFEEVIPQFAPGWRVVSLDQRSHGKTDHCGAHSVQHYISDIDALLAHLRITHPIVILGHSFGGMVGNLYAAARPSRMRALIMEDIDVARDDNDEFMLDWSGSYQTENDLKARIGEELWPYLRKSIVHDGSGWRLNFEPREILQSEHALNGDHWAEWLSHDCPCLIIRGSRSVVTAGETLAEMARRRPNTHLVTIDASHSVHIDAPEHFVAEVNAFLLRLI